MRRSLGLILYTFTSARRNAAVASWPERPAGALVWLHVGGAESLRAMAELARRLHAEDGCTIVLTSDRPLPPQAGVIQIAPAPDTPTAAQEFLDHWRPKIGVLSEGEVMPVLLDAAARRGLPLLMVNGREPVLPGRIRGFWPGLMRGALMQFRRIVTVDEAAARQFRRRGAPDGAVRADGRMEERSHVLPCTEAERAALVRQFQTRPVWLAACLPETEEAAVIAAHRAALRMAHRLLLILVTDTPERAEVLAQQLAHSENWTVARRSADEEPDEETEVFLIDTPVELGLWYRLAPITFLGGSLYGGGCRRDPFEAAALGSAILHGPQAGAWKTAFQRLAEARAARIVTSPGDLADGLADLLSPDRAARLAQGAWAVASAGAEVTDRIVQMIHEAMEHPA